MRIQAWIPVYYKCAQVSMWTCDCGHVIMRCVMMWSCNMWSCDHVTCDHVMIMCYAQECVNMLRGRIVTCVFKRGSQCILSYYLSGACSNGWGVYHRMVVWWWVCDQVVVVVIGVSPRMEAQSHHPTTRTPPKTNPDPSAGRDRGEGRPPVSRSEHIV